MRQYCNLVFLILFVFSFWVSCQKKDAQKGTSDAFHKPMQTVKLSNALNAVVDSFMVELESHTRKNIKLVTYIKILESKENKQFKIVLEAIDNEALFEKMHIDHYFVKQGFYFCLDYNCSHLLKVNPPFSKSKIIQLTEISKFPIPDYRIPAWLVEIVNDTVVRINKNAISLFGPKERMGYFTDEGTTVYDINEWGEVLDKNGKVIDYFPPR